MSRTASCRQARPLSNTPASTHPITKYGRVSKSQTVTSKTDKKVLAVCLPNAKAWGPITVTPYENPGDEENFLVHIPRESHFTEVKPLNGKKRKATLCDSQPTAAPASPLRSQKRSRANCVLPLNIALESPIASATSPTQIRRKSTKNATPPSILPVETQKEHLPAELLELFDLQRAILKTVVLQITHQNNNTPVDVASIVPHISRTWGKRKVTLDDIRTCIAVQDMEPRGEAREIDTAGSPFIVTDYGRGKLCLEMHVTRGVGRIDEDKLLKQFKENLRVLCAERAMDEMSDLDISFENLNFGDLPKSSITRRSHHITGQQNPLLAKGQRALADLKQGIILKQQEKNGKASAGKTSAQNPVLAGSGPKMSLLDRLRAKEVANAQLALPSGPELTRMRALQRVADVSLVIGMLVSSSNPTGSPKLSYTMAMLQQKLKDSARVPMPVAEGIDTVKLIANEVAPEWLKVVSIGGKEHVVIQTWNKPYDSEIMARVGRLGA